MITWQLLLDWDDEGTYGYDETAYLASVSIDRGRDNEFAEMRVGKLTFTLDNESRRFDPWNVSSPLYGKIKPGIGVRLSLTYDGVTYRLFTGQIEDWRDTGELGQRAVQATAYDGWRYLKASECSIGLQEGKRVDELIALVLDAVGWPSDMRDLQQGDVVQYFWTPRRSAASIIADLVASDYGLFFIDRYGRAAYRNRTTIVTSTTVGSLDAEDKADVQSNNPWETMYQRVKTTFHPISLASDAVIWQLVDKPSVGPGQSIEVWAEYVANGQACAATGVTLGAYSANSQPDGSGSDMTAYMDVNLTAFSTSAKVTVTNMGSSTFYVTALALRGQALTQATSTVVEETTATRKRELALDLSYQQSLLVAADFTKALLSFYSVPRPTLAWAMDMHLPEMVVFELGDRVHVTEPSRGINESMRIGAIRLQTAGSMQALTGEYSVEACSNTVFWLLGMAGNSELGITTRLGY